ncbi:CHAP domain-containing protein [Aeromicrobium sp. 636]|uniref:Ig-like domain repeat protein n=1 Tax=Aeromicrobium senzhongii TaxID=2663859 RepID=A0A8I0EUT3_9ACTN|nr:MULTISPECIES: Ig-like domain repeat protein [Aeromicrobium]MBC9225747.1 Ig-like domain repeat protein [Aeromicrobium senzhongii]MCQ3997856.1 CHAP domain-containing protein [Aeromicrobium sp. 636]
MRRLGLVGLVCLFVMAGLTATASSAQAFALICSAKTKAQVAACDTSGYAEVMHQMHWRMYAGHNCTNYAAYRMKRNGVPEPKILMGNARDWHTNAKKLGYVVDNRPAVGAIAQWSKAASHVAYVEEVGPKHLILSEDSYTSKVYRRYKVSTGDSWYPERFIHFKDLGAPAAPVPTPSPAPAPTPAPAAPVKPSVAVSGPAKVSTRVAPKITVKVSAARAAPVGKVRIRRGGVTVKTINLTAASKGTATVAIPRMKRGKQWISAVYAGNAQVGKGTSRTIKVVVTKPPKVVSAKTSIALPKAPHLAGTRPVATVTVKPTDGRVVTNKVSVYVDGKRIAAPALTKAKRGKVSVRLPALTAGKHTIRATYWGSKTVRRSHAKAQAFHVVEPTTVHATLDRTSVGPAESAHVTATVATARKVAPTSGEVWVLADGAKVAAATLGPAARGSVRIALPALDPGTRRIAVQYRGATFQTASLSAEVPLVVRDRSVTTTALSATSVKATASAKVTVTVQSGRGAAVTAGTITVKAGAKTIATANLTVASKGKVVVTLPRLAAGKHAITASFSGTGLVDPSAAAARTLTVTK